RRRHWEWKMEDGKFSIFHHKFFIYRWKWPARNLPAQHRGDLALEQLERDAVLLLGQAITIGVDVEHLVPQLLVIPQHFVDDLLRAANQSRTALDGVLERVEHRLHAPPAHRCQPRLEDRAIRRNGLLRRFGGVMSGGA